MLLASIEQLKSWYQLYAAFTSGNQVLGAVLAASLSASFWYAVSTLKSLWQFLYRMSFVKMTFTLDDNYVHRSNYYDFLTWVSPKIMQRLSRSYSLVYSHKDWSQVKGSEALGIGYGTHWFFYKGVLCRLNRIQDESNQSATNKETAQIFALTLNSQLLSDMVREIYLSNQDKPAMLYTLDKDRSNWLDKKLPVRAWSSLCLADTLLDTLTQSLDNFLKDEEQYRLMGVPYKYALLLDGEPGVGKSSLIRALATKYKRNLYAISLSQLTDASFQVIMQGIPPKSIVCIEDVDAFSVTHIREGQKESKNPLTLSGVLNGIDGVATLHDVIIVLTSNHSEKLDPALLRKGRIDQKLTLRAAGYEEVCVYLKRTMELQSVPVHLSEVRIRGCDLQSLVFNHRHDPQRLFEELEHYCANERKLFLEKQS